MSVMTSLCLESTYTAALTRFSLPLGHTDFGLAGTLKVLAAGILAKNGRWKIQDNDSDS